MAWEDFRWAGFAFFKYIFSEIFQASSEPPQRELSSWKSCYILEKKFAIQSVLKTRLWLFFPFFFCVLISSIRFCPVFLGCHSKKLVTDIWMMLHTVDWWLFKHHARVSSFCKSASSHAAKRLYLGFFSPIYSTFTTSMDSVLMHFVPSRIYWAL